MAGRDYLPFAELFEAPLRNGLTKPKSVRGEGMKMVNMGEVFGHRRIHNLEMDRVPMESKERDSSLLRSGDLLFARQSLVLSGAGKCVLFQGDKEDVTFESHIIRCRLDQRKAEPAFYFYLFQSSLGRSLIESIVEQVAAAGIRGSDLGRLAVPVPPLAEQKAIAAVLGALDDKIELNRRTNATLEAMARALFQSWFVDFDPVRAHLDPATAALFPASFQDSELGHIPTGWKIVKLHELCSKITDGAHQSPKSVERGFPMASVKDMTNWGINVEGCRHISEADYAELVANGCQPKIGDVLLAKDGATCLDTACEYQQPEEIVLLSSVAILRPKSAHVSSYLHIWLGLEATKFYLKESFVSGSAIPRVVLRDLKQARILLPSEEVLEAFNTMVTPLRNHIRRNDHQCRTLATLRDTLLPKLMNGELNASQILSTNI